MIYPSALLTVWFSAHFIFHYGMISAQTLFTPKWHVHRWKKQISLCTVSCTQTEKQKSDKIRHTSRISFLKFVYCLLFLVPHQEARSKYRSIITETSARMEFVSQDIKRSIQRAREYYKLKEEAKLVILSRNFHFGIYCMCTNASNKWHCWCIQRSLRPYLWCESLSTFIFLVCEQRMLSRVCTYAHPPLSLCCSMKR